MNTTAQQEGVTIDHEHETAKFRDHHISKGSAFKDVERAYRLWCRNSIRFAKNAAVARLIEADNPSKVTASVIDSVRLLIPSINEKLTKDYDIAGFSIGDADPEALSSALRKVEMAMLLAHG